MATNRRAPHGARGLKLNLKRHAELVNRRAPHGARGLKFHNVACSVSAGFRRAPHGARGLKSQFQDGHTDPK